MKNLKGILFIIAIIIIILIVTVVTIVMQTQAKQEKEKVEQEMEDQLNIPDTNLSLLTDRNKFYTIEYCVKRYFNYIANKDTVAILQTLDNDYKEKNSVTQDNVLEKIGIQSAQYVFTAQKMYVKEESFTKGYYYIYGTIYQEDIDGRGKEEDFYVTVIQGEGVFSIIPGSEVEIK